MEITTIDFVWLTLFNAVICLFLPRLVTFDWSQRFGTWNSSSASLAERQSEAVIVVRDR